MRTEIDVLLIPADASLRDAMTAIDRSQIGIALVVEADRRLVGTVTDGDIRRAMLSDLDLESPVQEILDRQRDLREPRPMPLTAPVEADPAVLVTTMRRYDVHRIPLVDAAGRVKDLALLEDLIDGTASPLRAVVMAGGFGTRLGSLTEQTPKPMLPVGDRPLLERIIGQLRECGIHRVNLTTHYRADAIADYFGDGRKFGVEIEYVSEERPLGTAGALGLLEAEEPVLVMNGDILTRVDFRAMHRFHDDHRADMTVAVRPYEVRVPYGVVELVEETVTGITEKPLVRGFVNAGIYLIAPQVLGAVEPNQRLEMPDLIAQLVSAGHRVVGFPLREYWLDIGQVADYEQAVADVEAL
jgi:dTDP-glucose pyrophosphorylase